MNDITCPNCGKPIEISQALQHQIEEQITIKLKNQYTEEFEKQKEKIKKQTEDKIKEDLNLQIKNSANEVEESKKKNEQLQTQLLELTKNLRELKDKDQTRELEMQKKLLDEREKMKDEISKNIQEKSNLEILEMKKQLDDTKKALEEAQRKAAQKSQQLQGEVLELELEELLRNAFPLDQIEPVAKGVNGADIKHLVKTPMGNICGIILWEFKRTKHFDDKWTQKLKDDLRNAKANIPVIVSMELPLEAKSGMGIKDGVWICNMQLVIPLAELLRKNLYDIARQKAINDKASEKADLIYQYITSHEFQQQVESIIETYTSMQQQLMKEKTAFERIWKVREGQIDKLLRGTANIIGSIQGKGATLPSIKGLNLIEDVDQQNLLE